MNFPSFDTHLPALHEFIHSLVKEYERGTLRSWEELDQRIRAYFTPQRTIELETLVPGWQKMASYSGGITRVHVMCVFLGLSMLPEFQKLTAEQKQMAKWIVLFHDIAKLHLRDKRDTMHAFRSAVQAANTLPDLGFPITTEYPQVIQSWGDLTTRASTSLDQDSTPKPDNRKLPAILAGIDRLFGRRTPAALITETVLLHISLAVDPFYVTPAPLTEYEIKSFIDADLLPLLKVMMLADNEGWSIFDPETRARQRQDTLQTFQKIEKLIFA
jgi:hypothetical protein